MCFAVLPGELVLCLSLLIEQVKGNIGPGILALPFNFQHVGVYGGLCITLIVAVQGIYSMILLLQLQRSASALLLNKNGYLPLESLSFEEVGEAILGRSGRSLVQVTLTAMQMAICAIAISFCATALLALLPVGKLFAVLLVWAVAALLAMLPTLRSLVPLSVFGIIVMLLAVGSSLGAAITDLLSLEPLPSPPPPSNQSSTIGHWGSAFAATFFAFEGIGLILPIHNQYDPGGDQILHGASFLSVFQERGSFDCIVCAALSGVAALFAVVGCVCGAAFPDLWSASITAYLASRGPFFACVNLLVALGVILTFPLQLTPAYEVLDLALGLQRRHGRCLLRQFLVICCVLLVLVMPNLNILIDVAGACANTLLGALPCSFHIALTLKSPRPLDPTSQSRVVVTLIIDVLVIIFCAGVFLFGIRSALAPFSDDDENDA